MIGSVTCRLTSMIRRLRASRRDVGDPATALRFSSRPRPLCSSRRSTASKAAGLACPTVRMALEKPLGTDLNSSREINDAVAARFPRRPHVPDRPLSRQGNGPEPARAAVRQLAVRAAVERAHIDHVQITVAETVGLEGRADYYDAPARCATWSRTTCCSCSRWWRWSRRPTSTRPRCATKRSRCCARCGRSRGRTSKPRVTGQYTRGAIDGEPVPGYDEELGHDSQTETFVAIKAHVDNWRWKGVPFYLRTGKRMPAARHRNLHPVQGRALFDLRLARRDDQAEQADDRRSSRKRTSA